MTNTFNRAVAHLFDLHNNFPTVFLTASRRTSENTDIRTSFVETQIWYICGGIQDSQF